MKKDQNYKAKIRYNVSQTMFMASMSVKALTDIQFTLTCNVCKVTPYEINDLYKIGNKPVAPNAL